eukprot:m.195517 g.195517  ORF g.195517 m.195517 type:complete len:450 (+) comp18677_c0_seq1:194-1543(+)
MAGTQYRKALSLCLGIFLMGKCGCLSISTWRNSSADIHSFWTFDSGVSESTIKNNPNASTLDFVWGASAEHIPAYRASSNPSTILSFYIPFARDPNRTLMANCTGPTPAECPGLVWYQANRPEFVVYQCDGKTPAWNHYNGEGWAESALIPLDVSSDAVIDWQVETLVRPAIDKGYDAIAWDNFGLNNNFKACGVFRNGRFVKLYSGETSGDPAYEAAMVSWISRIKKKVNAIQTVQKQPTLIIPNWSIESTYHWNDSVVFQVGNNTDGALSEAGFSDYGCASGCTVGAAWVNKILFARNLQAHGKAYYAINEIGDRDHPGNWSKSCAQDTLNCITAAKRQYVIASLLMAKEQAAGVFISGVQQYGWGSFCPECNAKIGDALEEPVVVNPTVWERRYESAYVAVNFGTETISLSLDAKYTYSDVSSGKAVTSPLVLNAGNATILLTHPA